MLNKERQAETEVDSDKMLIDISSAQMPQNPMLSAALSYSEKFWFGRFIVHCRKNERRYAVTWHMRLELTGFTTAQINYGLSKLVKKGLLKKEANKYCTKFYYASDFA